MARRKRKEITPKLPLRDKTPKFLKVFKVPRSRTSTGPEMKPHGLSKSNKVPHLPKLFHAPPSSPSKIPFPPPSTKPQKYPHLVRFGRALKSLLLKVEPDKPIRMPSFPSLAFPSLYTRYSIMKTYTAVTDSNGRITVTFPRVFRKIPGVVISPQDGGTWFEHVLSKDEFGFTVQILKTAHAHQHANSGGGGGHKHTGDTVLEGGHTPTIGEGGGSKESGQSDSSESIIVITQATKTVGTVSPKLTSCNIPMDDHLWGCKDVWDIEAINFAKVLTPETHKHTTNINHSNHNASTIPDHQHDFDDVSTEPDHEHTVPDSNEKEASLLANTSVTFTYFAQEES